MPDTYFAPAGRSFSEQLEEQCRIIDSNPLAQSLLDAMPDPALILNGQRQIVGINSRLLAVFGAQSAEAFIGLRPGEAFACIHHQEGPDGCGTAPSCSVCGAVMTILACIETGQQTRGECRLTLRQKRIVALDLEIVATPLYIGGEPYFVCALKDIGAEKWKSVMERTFFHDIINTAGGIRGLAALLAEPELDHKTEQECKQWMLSLSDTLIDDIKHQRNLIAAEKGEYVPKLEHVDLGVMMKELRESFIHNERTAGRGILLEVPPAISIKTDPPIFRRIVGNMLMNAIEAAPSGASVTVRCSNTGETVRIEVENPGDLREDVQLQIFKRSFSTKSTHGRGIGTYSIKLFGEQYLGGEVGFSSGDGKTRFYILLPAG
jgi:hypothetical protein